MPKHLILLFCTLLLVMTSNAKVSPVTKKSHLYLITQDKVKYKADKEKLVLIINHEIRLLKEKVKLDDDKTVVAFDKKLIELLQKQLVVVDKEIGILKTLD